MKMEAEPGGRRPPAQGQCAVTSYQKLRGFTHPSDMHVCSLLFMEGGGYAGPQGSTRGDWGWVCLRLQGETRPRHSRLLKAPASLVEPLVPSRSPVTTITLDGTDPPSSPLSGPSDDLWGHPDPQASCPISGP